MPLKQAGDVSIIAPQCHSLEHPQSTSKHWLKRGKIMTVNNKKESWLSHGQDLSASLPFLSPFLSLLLFYWIILSPWKLLPCPFDTGMINCRSTKVYMDQCMIVTFSKKVLDLRCWWGGGGLAACRVQVLLSLSIHRENAKTLLMPSQLNFTTAMALCMGYCLELHLCLFFLR